ncbi:MAG: capsular biosynthesis protein [Erythrobacter sp. 34-65-8]|nr:MAG: capsular biosynthesis protein [Erythrobacter sp. 34-65-8]
MPLPGEPDKNESSLFERASGAFGFDAFKPAPLPVRLPEEPMKRAKVRSKRKDSASAENAAPAEPAVVSEAPAAAPQHVAAPIVAAVADSLPVTLPAAPAEMTLTQGFEPVRFSGRKHKVDRDGLREQGMIVPGAPVSRLLEEFRIVKRQILSTARERGTAASRRVLVCSPLPGEGKTFCSVNLALSMANERETEVLLVDADFAKPSILSTLGLPKRPGFMDCLADPALQVEDLVMGTDVPGLWVLPAGNRTDADSEFLGSSRTVEVLDRLTLGTPNRIVIFDTPPALAASPAAELAKHVGQAMLVARADRTGQTALEDAYQLLSACPDIKLLLNAVNFSPSGRRFGNYYGYGE